MRAMLINLNLTENRAICHVMAVMSYCLNDLNVYYFISQTDLSRVCSLDDKDRSLNFSPLAA